MGIADYSRTPASNTAISGLGILGTDLPSNFDNAIRQLMADVRSDLAFGKIGTAIDDSDIDGSNILTLPDDGSTYVMTGTQQVDSIATIGAGTEVKFIHNSARTFTHHATDVICPQGVDLKVVSGDVTHWVEYAAGDWRCVSITPKSSAKLRQILANPIFQHSQENGTTAVGHNTWPADQWRFLTSHASNTAAQTANGSENQYPYYLRMSYDTSATAAGDVVLVEQPVEGTYFHPVAWPAGNGGVPLTIIVRVKTSAAGNYCLYIKNGTSGRSYVTDLVTTTTDWETHRFVIPAPLSGPWVYGSANGSGVIIGVTAKCGSTFQATSPNTWEGGNFVGTSNIDNPTTAGTIDLLYMLAFPGEVAVDETDIPRIIVDDLTDLERCKRYWRKNDGLPIQGMSGTAATVVNAHGKNMRVNPTLAILSGTNAVLDPAAGGFKNLSTIGSSIAEYFNITISASATGGSGILLADTVSMDARQ